jgi:two-component system, LuxR family, sensor kinase FixL
MTTHSDDGPRGGKATEPLASPLHDPPAALHGRLLNVSRMATVGEMAAGVAHELNQPLTAISNYAHACERLLGRPDTDPAEFREALRQISAQAMRAADIIRRLRALAQSRQAEHTSVNVNDLVAELHDLLQTDAITHGVQLSLDLAPGLPAVRVDAGQVQHVIVNFVRNSLEALSLRRDPAASIVIRTSTTENQEVELAVSDNGPGLPDGLLGRMFDPFFSTKENGTGLGLAMSSSIARAHGGSVGYRPNSSGGACFFIVLPTPPPE